MSEINREELESLRGLLVEEDPELAELLELASQGDEAAFGALVERAEVLGYHRPPGTDPAIPPGTLMVCPKDPAHYRQYRSRAAEVLRCPRHKLALIPISEATP